MASGIPSSGSRDPPDCYLTPGVLVQEFKDFIRQEIQSVKKEMNADLRNLAHNTHADVEAVKARIDMLSVDMTRCRIELTGGSIKEQSLVASNNIETKTADGEVTKVTSQSTKMSLPNNGHRSEDRNEGGNIASDNEISSYNQTEIQAEDTTISHSVAKLLTKKIDSFFGDSSTLDIPNGSLVEMISHINPIDRLVLADSHPELNSLIFENEELLRELDFSENGQLVKAADIERYFSKETTCKVVRKINVQCVACITPGNMLNNSIGRAVNLVDLNIRGTKFNYVEQLGEFLVPFRHLKRLSVNWPEYKKDFFPRLDIQIALGRLTFLSVEVTKFTSEFLFYMRFCQKLEELDMILTQPCPFFKHLTPFTPGLNKLVNLKIVRVRGQKVQVGDARKSLIAMIPDPADWTSFEECCTEPDFYIEKKVTVHKELSEVRRSLSHSRISCTPATLVERVGNYLQSEILLGDAIRFTHKDVPMKFCCLANSGQPSCRLKLDEAKQLLEDPGYQISYLRFEHDIETDCDVHLIGSAFPNLTKLLFRNIVKKHEIVSTFNDKKPIKRRLTKKDSTEPNETEDSTSQDSSFKMLVENTPRLRDLTITACSFSLFDSDVLDSISRWKNLRTLRLEGIRILEGNFLTGVGRECSQLSEIYLSNLSSFGSDCCYMSALLQMLKLCKNLRALSIHEFQIPRIPELFATLADCSSLRTLRLSTETVELASLMFCTKWLLRSCTKLTAFDFTVRSDTSGMVPAMQRIIDELKLPNLQFRSPPHTVFCFLTARR